MDLKLTFDYFSSMLDRSVCNSCPLFFLEHWGERSGLSKCTCSFESPPPPPGHRGGDKAWSLRFQEWGKVGDILTLKNDLLFTWNSNLIRHSVFNWQPCLGGSCTEQDLGKREQAEKSLQSGGWIWGWGVEITSFLCCVPGMRFARDFWGRHRCKALVREDEDIRWGQYGFLKTRNYREKEDGRSRGSVFQAEQNIQRHIRMIQHPYPLPWSPSAPTEGQFLLPCSVLSWTLMGAWFPSLFSFLLLRHLWCGSHQAAGGSSWDRPQTHTTVFIEPCRGTSWADPPFSEDWTQTHQTCPQVFKQDQNLCVCICT